MRLSLFLTAVAAAAAILAAPAVASPHFLKHGRHLTVAQKVRYFERAVAVDRHSLAWLEARTAPRTLERLTSIGWYRDALRWHRGELALYRSKLTPAGHWRLWECITNGAYPGAPHEGNGYNGAYTGPLGMTTPWAGHNPTGSDWVHTPLAVVYGDAEQEYRTHLARGDATSWLEGQWPRTAPPCLNFA